MRVRFPSSAPNVINADKGIEIEHGFVDNFKLSGEQLRISLLNSKTCYPSSAPNVINADKGIEIEGKFIDIEIVGRRIR